MEVLDRPNIVIGGIVAALTMVFGEYWVLFAFFLLFNVADWVTGWMKSRMAGKENSVAGLLGIMKKVGYWLMVVLAFAIGHWLTAMCSVLGMDSIIPWDLGGGLGFWVLAALTVNELRSILENFVEAGFDVPKILVAGLEVADKAFNKDGQLEDKEGD